MNTKLLLAFKVVLFLLLSWFIIDQLFVKNDFNAQFAFCIEHMKSDKAYLLILAIMLMPVNWGLETLKWKTLLRTSVSMARLAKSVLAGITVGFVTPGRSGEFIGRIMFLNDGNGARTFYLSSIGGMAQTAASLIVGIPFVQLWHNDIFITEVVTGCALFYLLVFFRFDLLNRFLSASSVLQKYGLVMSQEDMPEINLQVRVLLLSLFRFGVYLLQYVLLLSFFGIEGDLIPLTTYSAVYLLALTISPLMPLLDFSYRGACALYVFKDFSNNDIGILCSVMGVWIINLVLPALVGYILILRGKTIRLPWVQ